MKQTQGITEEQVFITVAKRLKAARRHARLNQPEVAAEVGQKGLTQISLWESGERQPKLIDLVRLSRLYGVPLDFLCGLSDDPIADSHENNQGFMLNLIAGTINKHHSEWVVKVSEAIAVAASSLKGDRTDLRRISQELKALRTSYFRLKELNPEFDEEIRGASKFELGLTTLTNMVNEANERIEGEIRQCAAIDNELKIADNEYERGQNKSAKSTVSQMMLSLIEA